MLAVGRKKVYLSMEQSQDLSALLPNIANQMRGLLSSLHLAAAQAIPAQAREQDPALDAKAAVLDQSFYRLLRLVNSLSAAEYLTEDHPLPLRDTDVVKLVGTVCETSGDLAELLGIKRLWVKDDGQNPTASLKDRASAMAVAKAKEAGKDIIACSSTGNAASSLAGNAAAAGMKTYIFVPERAPKGKVAQLMIFGANVISVKGNYEETFKMSAEAIEKWGWYNRNAAINPYLSEGKKTVSLEIAEQLNWEMPDYLAISVGDGCTIAGVWKGLKDLYAIGFIDKLPRLISAQAEGCHPINRAIAENKPWEPMEENTLADSIAVGVPRNADKALMAIRESNGIVVNVTDEEIMAAQKLLGTTCGVFGEPAGVTGTAAVKKLCEQGVLGENDTVVSVVTGNGLKDVTNAIKSAGEPINIKPDLDLMVEEFAKRGVTVE